MKRTISLIVAFFFIVNVYGQSPKPTIPGMGNKPSREKRIPELNDQRGQRVTSQLPSEILNCIMNQSTLQEVKDNFDKMGWYTEVEKDGSLFCSFTKNDKSMEKNLPRFCNVSWTCAECLFNAKGKLSQIFLSQSFNQNYENFIKLSFDIAKDFLEEHYGNTFWKKEGQIIVDDYIYDESLIFNSGNLYYKLAYGESLKNPFLLLHIYYKEDDNNPIKNKRGNNNHSLRGKD